MEITVTIVDFGLMQSAIDGYKKVSQQIQAIIDAYQAILKALQVAQVFTGGAASTMIATINTYVQAMNQAKQNLDELVNVLSTKLENYQAADKQAQSIASGAQQAVWQEV